MQKSTSEPLAETLFQRLDSSPDADFYQSPRFVAHIDAATIDALRTYYAEILFSGADVLDLMSSWISHLPDDIKLGRVAGLGMNDAELIANPQLNETIVHDLNEDPHLPYLADSFDFAFIAVSIQYLIQPIAVIADIARILRPRGKLLIACSHRCFPTKAIRAFHEYEPQDRLALIAQYIEFSRAFSAAEIIDRSPANADPLWLVSAEVLNR